jgi:hypothetical protein
MHEVLPVAVRQMQFQGRMHELGRPIYGSFLWGYLKEYIYAVTPTTIKDLVTSLQAAVTLVDANMLKRVR